MNDAAVPHPSTPVAAAAGLGACAALLAVMPRLPAAVLIAGAALLLLCGWTLLAPHRWLSLLLAAALLLPPLPFALGNSGPHPALLFAALGLLAGLLRRREWRFKKDLLATALVVYLAVLLASAALAALYSGAAAGAASLARVLLFAVSVYVFFYTAYGPATSRPGLRLLFSLGAASALFACLDFYFQFPAPAGFGPQFVWLPGGMFRRAQGVFYEASTLGNLCAFFLVMIAAALVAKKEARPVSRPALAAGAVVFGAALIFSFSRASLVNVGAALLALVALRRVRISWLVAVLGTAAVTVAASFWLLPAFAELYWGRLRGTAQFVFSATEIVLSGRAETWRALGGFLASHPWHMLFGVGYKTLPYSKVAGQPIIVDNMYLSMLAETGVVGLAALLLLNVAILRAGWRAAHHLEPRRAFLGAWIFCFWTGEILQMLSGDLLTYWRVLPVYLWVLALAVR